MVAHIRGLAVTRKRWLSEQEFQQGVALCQAVPGATAMQCAAYVGLRVGGMSGAVSSYVGFGLPAFLLMLSLSVAYEHTAGHVAAASVLVGLRALVVALVGHAAWTFGRLSLKGWREAVVALAAGILFFAGGNPFGIVVAAALTGALVLRTGAPAPWPAATPASGGWRALHSPALLAALGTALLAFLALTDARLAVLGYVMMKVDVFAFGGGFASMPLMYREVVEARHWLPAAVFMDGIALGQVTRGPIVITGTFVGYHVAGLPGALVATACILSPSLLVIVLVEPWFRRLRSSVAFQGASRGLILSFVGLLGSVTAQFALVLPWSPSTVVLAVTALAALLFGVDVLLVVAGAVLWSALV